MKERWLIRKLLLWDIDGTLISGKGTGRRAMNRSCSKMFGLSGAFDEIPMSGGLDLNIIGAAFDKHQLPHARIPDFLDIYYEELRQEVSVSNTELFPGVPEILERTRQDSQICNALGTGNLETGARIKLERFDLNRYFPVGGFCTKPAERYEMLQHGIQNACNYYGVSFHPAQVVVIGDTLRDIEAARKIHARVVAVATGGNTFEELEAAGPDLLLGNFSEDERFFAWLSN